MGWIRYLLFGDLGQQLDLRDHEARLTRLAAASRQRSHEHSIRIEALEQEVLALGAGVAALVDLVRTKGLATDAEVGSAIEAATRRAEQGSEQREEGLRARSAAATKKLAAKKLEEVRRRRGQ